MKKKLSDFTKNKESMQTEENSSVKDASSKKNMVERVGVTLRLSRSNWERLHYLSIQERTKIQKFLFEGINKVFEERGLEKMQDE